MILCICFGLSYVLDKMYFEKASPFNPVSAKEHVLVVQLFLKTTPQENVAYPGMFLCISVSHVRKSVKHSSSSKTLCGTL